MIRYQVERSVGADLSRTPPIHRPSVDDPLSSGAKRRCRFIAHTADSSAIADYSDTWMNK
jgi:hypothetical protein